MGNLNETHIDNTVNSLFLLSSCGHSKNSDQTPPIDSNFKLPPISTSRSDITFIGINDTEHDRKHDHASCFNSAITDLSEDRDLSVSYNVVDSMTKSECLDLLGDSKIVITRSHGIYDDFDSGLI